MSGVVAALGPDVTETGVGAEVYGLIPFVRDGAAAEYVTVPADILAAKPATVDHDAAAAVPLAALTVWQALVDHANLRAGQHVLIHGAAGGVGSFAVQIAASLGARVTATARARDRDFVTKLGAHEVVDYANERFEDHVDGVDVVLDLVGGETQARSWSVLRPGGVLGERLRPAGRPAGRRARGPWGVLRRRAEPRPARDHRSAHRDRPALPGGGPCRLAGRYARRLRGAADGAPARQGRHPCRGIVRRGDDRGTRRPPDVPFDHMEAGHER